MESSVFQGWCLRMGHWDGETLEQRHMFWEFIREWHQQHLDIDFTLVDTRTPGSSEVHKKYWSYYRHAFETRITMFKCHCFNCDEFILNKVFNNPTSQLCRRLPSKDGWMETTNKKVHYYQSKCEAGVTIVDTMLCPRYYAPVTNDILQMTPHVPRDVKIKSISCWVKLNHLKMKCCYDSEDWHKHDVEQF